MKNGFYVLDFSACEPPASTSNFHKSAPTCIAFTSNISCNNFVFSISSNNLKFDLCIDGWDTLTWLLLKTY